MSRLNLGSAALRAWRRACDRSRIAAFDDRRLADLGLARDPDPVRPVAHPVTGLALRAANDGLGAPTSNVA